MDPCFNSYPDDLLSQRSTTSQQSHPRLLIAVHAGAGFHHPSKRPRYMAAIEAACRAGMMVLEAAARQSTDLDSQSLPSLTTPASAAAAAAVAVLEDNPVTNAGTGSNLTLDGHVECDAAVMCGRSGAFGAVGAVPGVKNPVLGAHVVMAQEAGGALPLPGGRVAPMLLAGKGAWRFCKDAGLSVFERVQRPRKRRKMDGGDGEMVAENVLGKRIGDRVKDGTGLDLNAAEVLSSSAVLDHTSHHRKRRRPNSTHALHSDSSDSDSDYSSTPSSLGSSCPDDTPHLTPAALATHARHLRIVQSSQSTHVDSGNSGVVGIEAASPTDEEDFSHDTVAAIALDHLSNIASACSSGGISLKMPGRVGEAAVYGAGCWAQNGTEAGVPAVAVACSGTGEQIMRTRLAEAMSDYLCRSTQSSMPGNKLTDDGDGMDVLGLESYFTSHVMNNPRLARITTSLAAGALALRVECPAACSTTQQNDTTKKDGLVEETLQLGWCHTTPTMAVGWLASGMDKVGSVISQRIESSSKVVGDSGIARVEIVAGGREL
ncbi:N-terminal nucleophile aminohydrolase [Gonapodya prolifera JEL478]|uniref:N-terminal nucleophile aminohydrolase n=1 Tax=Gonapodya prolifera (strain JEL478) TaxID=1344416 RepID=A0A139AUI9_GONPJ|nr:N-terminal nucleophile aminohydrolase [Gonapodya prolifera JEL478]|eukprot:KXS20377.1 N-terminal nucleophile aminohydrolase [Gonapodya prolifera JEL478]